MTTTLHPDEGVRGHEIVATPHPTVQVLPAGPGRLNWRVYDPGASHPSRVHNAYAAGRVLFPVQATRAEMNQAWETAKAEAESARRQVAAILYRRQREQEEAKEEARKAALRAELRRSR